MSVQLYSKVGSITIGAGQLAELFFLQQKRAEHR
jgi:hypothetical protein